LSSRPAWVGRRFEGSQLDGDAVPVGQEVTFGDRAARLAGRAVGQGDPAIYLVAAEKLGLPAGACVLVDDVAANLPPAAELGMATIHHTNSAATVHQLERVFGLGLN
jgi:beta-phosphoglucomutase-like phosphatase (HAD superfamily)